MFGDQKSYDVWRRKVCEKKVEIFNFRRKRRIYLGSTWTIVNPSGFMLKKKICSKKLTVSCTSWFSLVPQLYFPGALMENLCCRIIAEYVVVFLRCSNSISLVPQLYFLAAPIVDLCCRQLESSRLVSSGSSLSRTGHAPSSGGEMIIVSSKSSLFHQNHHYSTIVFFIVISSSSATSISLKK